MLVEGLTDEFARHVERVVVRETVEGLNWPFAGVI
jgi:hypothetical protein